MQNQFNQAYQNALNQSNYNYQSQAAYYAKQQSAALASLNLYSQQSIFQFNSSKYTKMIKEVTIDSDNKKTCSITFCYGLSRYREYDRDNRITKKQ